MNRRGFLGSILALAAAPAIVRADSPRRIFSFPAGNAYCRDDWIYVQGMGATYFVSWEMFWWIHDELPPGDYRILPAPTP